MRRVLITGASGFIGGAVARQLLQSETYDEVWALGRRDPKLPGLHFIQADITDKLHLPLSFETADIVHAAGLAQDGWSPKLELVNRTGTTHMLQLAPAGRFVHISSSSIYDLSEASNMVKETAFQVSGYHFYNGYSRSKAQAELAVQTSGRQVQPVILRPHAVYGPGDTTLLPRLVQRIRGNTLVLPNAGRVLHSLTSVHNLVQAVEASLQLTPKRVEAYNITDAQPVILAEAIRAVLPTPLRIMGVRTERLLRARHLLPSVSEYELRQLGFNRTYSISKARQDLGYDPTGFVMNEELQASW